MTAARHLTEADARRLTLALQHISLPADAPLDVVRRLTAVQTQYAASLPGALWARTPNVTPAWIADALTVERTLVKTWTVRGTLHTIVSDEIALHVGGYGQYSQKWINARFRNELGVSDDEAQRLLRLIFEALADGPVSRTALHDRIPELKQLPNAGWGHDMKALVVRGDVVFASSRTSTAPIFAQRAQWLPDVPFAIPDMAEAIAELIRRYLRGHAPASANDVRMWLSMYARDVKPIWEKVVGEFVPVTIEGQRGTFYLHADDLPLLDALPAAPPARLLPKFDALTLAHRGGEKSRIVDPAYYKRIFGAAAQVEAVVLLDGKIAGTWRYKTTPRKMTVNIDMFQPPTSTQRKQVVKQAEQFAAWNGAADAEIVFTMPQE